MWHIPRWSLKGKVALVTGATKGIGSSVADELVRLGARVVIVSRTEADVQRKTSELIVQHGKGAAIGCTADVSSASGRETVFEYVNLHVGHTLDILVNNVGSNIRKETTQYSEEEVSTIIDTNMLSFFHLTRCVREKIGCITITKKLYIWFNCWGGVFNSCTVSGTICNKF